MNGQAILENVRRYRAIASLHRQTAAFRPHQRWSLLEQASEWNPARSPSWKPILAAATAASRWRPKGPARN